MHWSRYIEVPYPDFSCRQLPSRRCSYLALKPGAHNTPVLWPWPTPLAGMCFWRCLKILKVCSRPKFAQESKSGLRSGRGCSEVFFGGEHFDITIKNSHKNKNLTPTRPQKVSILKSPSLKNTAIEKKLDGDRWEIWCSIDNRRVFWPPDFSSSELLPANFYR